MCIQLFKKIQFGNRYSYECLFQQSHSRMQYSTHSICIGIDNCNILSEFEVL